MFFYDPTYKSRDTEAPEVVNMADCIGSFPESVIELADRALMNISILYPNYGQDFYPEPVKFRAVFDHKGKNEHYMGVFELLEDLGLIKSPAKNHVYKITAKGWERISDLKHKEKEVRQGFIAMSFRKETISIREAFRQAISEAGYAVRVIK